MLIILGVLTVRSRRLKKRVAALVLAAAGKCGLQRVRKNKPAPAAGA